MKQTYKGKKLSTNKPNLTEELSAKRQAKADQFAAHLAANPIAVWDEEVKSNVIPVESDVVKLSLVDKRFPSGYRDKTELTPHKGMFGGNCNVTACQLEKSAYIYNHGTSKYYCYHCAKEIADANNWEVVIVDIKTLHYVKSCCETPEGTGEGSITTLRTLNSEFIEQKPDWSRVR